MADNFCFPGGPQDGRVGEGACGSLLNLTPRVHVKVEGDHGLRFPWTCAFPLPFWFLQHGKVKPGALCMPGSLSFLLCCLTLVASVLWCARDLRDGPELELGGRALSPSLTLAGGEDSFPHRKMKLILIR